MREYLEKYKTTLEGYERRASKRPTGHMMMSKFRGIRTVQVGDERRMARRFTEVQLSYLRALGVSTKIFTISKKRRERGG